MKKFFVGLLSMFVLLGATILTACTTNNIQMTLSTQYVEIQIGDDTVPSTAEVTVTVTGTSDSQVSVDARDTSILSYRTEGLSDGRTVITITGLSEGYGQIYVTSYQGNITKIINVDVFSEVSAMEQRTEETDKKSNFAIRGDSIELIDYNLLTFYPSSNSRRTITWELYDGEANASINGNVLTISPEYQQNTIIIRATTEKGVTCDIELPVIDQLEDDLTLSWSYSRDNQQYDQITEDNSTFTIVPNLASDEQYTGYVKLNFTQDLEVSYTVTDSFGNATDQLIIESTGEDGEGNPIYAIYTNKNITSLNEDFVVYFEVGYSDYDLPAIRSLPIYVSVREKVNGITISTDGADNIEGTTQVLYSQYRNIYGKEYFVEVTPTTVVNASGRYSISVEITNGVLPEGGLSSGCPVEFWYQDSLNNTITQALLEYDGNVYTTRDENMLSADRIYMKAASDLRVQNFEGIRVTFRSADNEEVTNTFDVQLIKSVTQEDFVFEDADFNIDSSASGTAISQTKYFTLQGQTTIDGLYLDVDSENVTLTGPTFVSATTDSVTFAVTLTLNRSSYGVTSIDHYKICHENGFESKEFDINIFLPFNSVVILHNASASVTDYSTNNLSYDLAGNVIQENNESLSSIMLKNGSTTPLFYSFNSSGNYEAVADIDVSYYDFVASETMTLDVFKNLVNTQDGILQIIENARANQQKYSAVAYFSADNSSIITSGVGFTYAVATFTGKGVDGDVTIIKIILIESYVAPDGMRITPSSDGQVNLYSANTVATRDDDLTKKTITINFTNTGITYKSIDNIRFVSTVKDSSGNSIMGESHTNSNSVAWDYGRYTIENITITDSQLRFTISTISNYEDFTFFDELEVHYQLLIDGEDGQEVLDVMWTTINITIRNAERVSSINWENSDEDGIYFEVGDDEPYYLILTTAPQSARNSNITYLITDDNGDVIDNDTFVNVNSVTTGTIGVSLSDIISQGTTGYIYLLPEDAIYNGNIIFSYYVDDQIVQSQVSARALGLLRSDGQTWYDFLVGNAFFTSNTSLDGEMEMVYFSDILLKIKITVADGSSFDYAYRIYDENSFNGIIPSLYYTVMNSLDISSTRVSIDSFSGGLQGYDENVTINFNGANFANTLTEDAIIRNITFQGTVTGQGFVANTNDGTIENVTVDVYQTYPSVLNYDGREMTGGLVGVNNGTISGSSVLGLTINAQNATVGGIAGQNNGEISYGRVEFYNLTDRADDTQTAYNTFTGAVVGGIVGQATEGSSILYSYAYNYNIDNYIEDNISVINATIKGTIVGQLSGQTRIYYSFGVIDNVAYYAGNDMGSTYANITSNSDFYWSYYLLDEYTSSYYNENSGNLISSGSGYYTYVNNENPHFRDLYQEEKVTDVTGGVIQNYDEDGYYKSLSVNENSGILFYYSVERGTADLTSSAQNDLNELNTISLSQLLDLENVTDNIIITSSDTSIVRTIGSSIVVVGTGDVTLTISSKHDVLNTKTIDVKVMYALSQMIVSYTDNANNSYEIQENSVTYLQRTKSRQYTVTFENSTILLGNTASQYSLVANDMTLTMTPSVDNSLDITPINNIFMVGTNKDSVTTSIEVDAIITDGEYQSAINSVFSRSFTITPVDGVISFNYTGESIPLTPSTNAALRVEVDTTAQSDKDNLQPIISYNGDELHITKDEVLSANNKTVYHYTLPQDYMADENNYILSATVTLLNEDDAFDEETETYGYLFEISFSVYVDYRSNIARDMDFVVTFRSNSNIDSSDLSSGNNNGQVLLNLTRQKFTNIDVTSYKVENSYWTNDNGIYRTVHQKGDQTSVVTPGSNTILQVTANPSFAHYDYMELSYSNASVANAVSFELVMPYNNNNNFVGYDGADVSVYANTIRFTPNSDQNNDGTLYFRTAISSQVNSDSTIRFTASFFTSEGTLLSTVNYYLTINYLSEPVVLVDGETQSYVALGSTVDVEVQVRQDQVVESATLVGDNIQEVYISSLSTPITDPITGIKTYTASITAGVNASVNSSNNSLSLLVKVSRTINGVKESRDYFATITLVDIKVDTNNIQIVGADNGNLDAWAGVTSAFEVEYNVLPESYTYDHNDKESVAKVSELLQKRQEFLVNQYHVSSKTFTDASGESSTLIQYAINYDIENNRPYKLSERLFYIVNGNEEIPVLDNYRYTAGARFEFIENANGTEEAVIIGARQGETVQFRLKTFVYTSGSATGTPMTYNTDFTVTVGVYSDEDLPISINSASDFENLDPSNYTGTVTQNDYILMNDIVLDEHTPFNTNLISSLDGNGYTIHIRSFNLTSTSSELNIALFNNVLESTTLKNVRVNIYNGGQLTINLSALNNNVQINIAGLAISNAGIITNSEVVSFYTTGNAVGQSESLLEPATNEHNNPSGFNVKFIRGALTTESVYLTAGSSWSTQMAGFVISNSGNITNSRVGGDEVTILGEDRTEVAENGDVIAMGYTFASTIALDTFYMIGQGDMAGFVLTNSGSISASFVKLLDMENQSRATAYDTSGFAGTNSGTILTSYAEGKQDETNTNDWAKFAYTGTSLKSAYGIIAGFINSNNGLIKDSYSNILISNSSNSLNVYLASGFVYRNEGTIETSYSASQIANSRSTQMNFSGVNESGDLLANGTYTNCYYFNYQYYGNEEASDSSNEALYSTGAILIPDPENSTYFYGFAIADSEYDGIWSNVVGEGIKLIEPNIKTYSHRYVSYIAEGSEVGGVVGVDDQGEYVLPYAILQFTDSTREINTSLGSSNNPILIANAQDFVDAMGLSTSSYEGQYFNSYSIWGTYRLVGDVNLSDLSTSITLPSVSKSFSGRLYANGFTISNLSIASEGEGVAYGLFASLESRNGSTPLVSNLNLEIDQVIAGDITMVGGLAGYAKDSILVGIDISFSDDSQVNGLNFVGGLVGLSFGNSVIKNITVTNPNVIADRYDSNDYFTTESIRTIRNEIRNNLNNSTVVSSPLVNTLSVYSYAGSVVGYADHFTTLLDGFNINQAENFTINNIRVSGRVYVQGQVAGGIFGLTAYQTNVRDAGITIEADSDNTQSHIIATKFFAGGAIGQSFGSLSRIFAVYDDSTQSEIENNMSSFYTGDNSTERGATNLFYLDNSSYNQEYIGGLVGYVESGRMEISYSKLNVVSMASNFAGGIIGGINLSSANTYQAEAELLGDDQEIYTKYFINEVFATGDVRARQDGESGVMTAGGIIGANYGSGRIALMAVNALNYISNYDYNANSYLTFNSSINVSETFKTNLILGSSFDLGEGGEWVYTNLNDSNYTPYLNLIRLSNEGDAGQGSILSPTVAFYESYTFNGNIMSLNLFGDVDSSIEDNTLYETNYVYAINSPINYTSSAIGHTFTQQGFLSSGVWNTENWTHPTDDLFPSIQYQRVSNVIYLDAYDESIERAFDIMQSPNSDITIIVRGLVSADAEDTTGNYVDIDLATYFNNNYTPISNFSGSLVGHTNTYTTVDATTGEERPIRIISDQSFIESVGAGFYLDDVVIEYVPKSGSEIKITANNGNAGLFSTGSLNEATITNLRIYIDAPINTTVALNTGSNINVGILAPEIINSTIINVSIDTVTYPSSDFTDSDSLLNVYFTTSSSAGDNSPISVDSLSVGMLAGRMYQSSTSSTMQVNGLNMSIHSNLINIDGSARQNDSFRNTNFTNMYVGGYFGLIEREANALRMNLSLQGIERINSSNDENQRVTVSHASATNAYIAGYIGYNHGLDTLTLQSNFTGSVDVYLNDTSSATSSFTTLHTGIIFGRADNTNVNAINFNSARFDGGLYVVQNSGSENNVTITSLYAGGYAGSLGSSMTITNLSELNYEIVALSSASSGVSEISKDTLDSNDYASNTLTLGTANTVGTVKAGVVVGSTNAYFSMGADLTRLNANGESFRFVGISDDSAIGSVLGETTATSLAELRNNTVNITSGVVSYAQFVIIGSGDIDDSPAVGGIIGSVYKTDTTGSGNSISRVNVGAQNSSYVAFNGAVYSNISNITFGGIIGETNFTSASDTVSLINTSFGGMLKVYGANSQGGDVIAGGLVGRLGSPAGISQTIQATITNSFNYGDVYVCYDDNLEELDSYVFGGLLADISSQYRIVANGNYSMVTNHNARDEVNSTNTTYTSIGALFGRAPSPQSALSNNYYSSSVSLCIDNYGSDIGYLVPYIGDGYGYNSTNNLSLSTDGTNELSMLGRYAQINTLLSVDNVDVGHKLQPYELTNDTTIIPNSYKFNGMTYATISQNSADLSFTEPFTLEVGTELEVGTDKTTLKDVAIIGGAGEINYTVNDSSETHSSLINSLSGFSYVSGLVVNVDISTNSMDSEGSTITLDDNYSGIANSMYDNSQIFAVQVKGKMDIGGNKVIDVAGVVTNLYSGKIEYATTALDIIYRGASDLGDMAEVYGLVGLRNELNGSISNSDNNKFVFNSYTTGSITSYISANLYAFASTLNTNTFEIANSYSITKLDLNDYTTSGKPTGELSIFGVDDENDNITDSYYDYNAINASVLEDDTDYKQNTDYVTGLTNNSESNLGIRNNYDKGDYDFNYGYPTSKFGFLKTSSYVSAGTTTQGTNYDEYITETEYTRLANNTRPSDYGNVYFIIPNAGLLAKADDIDYTIITDEGTTTTEVRNFVLWYDIDLSQSQYSTWTSLIFETTTTTDNGDTYIPINFDGREKTISGLTSPLFDMIGPSTGIEVVTRSNIRNLRLTDAEISSNGLLAIRIYDSDISNITLSGSIKNATVGELIDESNNSGFLELINDLLQGLFDDFNITSIFGEDFKYLTIGALASEAQNSTISTVTNMVTIDVDDFSSGYSALAVGGIVGTMLDSTINYSSNYAPINVYSTANTAATQNYYVGGIVGLVVSADDDGESAINYSYNATSVMAGYANNSGLLTNLGQYYVGGVAGFSSADRLTIRGSYNSGTIKSGNKYNGKTNEDGNIQGFSYGGGIIAKAKNARVISCYNEGTIEALGSSPLTNFKWVMDGREDLVLSQTNERNVWAYAIGDIGDGSASGLAVLDASEDSVYMNGTMLEKDTEIQSWSWESISDYVQVSSARYSEDSVLRTDWWIVVAVSVIRAAKIEIDTEVVKPKDGETAEVYVNSYNSFGLPSSFITKLEIKSNIDYYYTDGGGGGVLFWFVIGGISWDNVKVNYSTSATNIEYAPIDNSEVYIEYVNKYNDSFVLPNYGSNNVSSNGSSIKRATRSNESSSEVKTVYIADQQYYIGDSNNLESIFNSGVYRYSIRANFDNLNIPYIENSSYYSVSAKGTNTSGNTVDLNTSINSVYKDEITGNEYIEFICYSFEELKGTIDYQVKLNYDVELSFNLTNVKYYYIDPYSIGIEVNGVSSLQPVSDYTIRSLMNAGISYDRVVKAVYVHDGGQLPEVAVSEDDFDSTKDPENVDVLYFGINDDNLLVYIPNAELTNGRLSRKVNVELRNEGTKDEEEIILSNNSSFNQNVQEIINKRFNGKIYYYTVEGLSTTNKDVVFTNIKGSANASVANASGSSSGSANIGYGEVVENWYNDNISSNQIIMYNSIINLYIANEYQFAGSVTNYTLYHGRVLIAQYSDTSAWSMGSSTTDSIILNGNAYNYTISSYNGNLMFTFADLNLNDAERLALETSLKSYIQENFVVVDNLDGRGEFASYASFTTDSSNPSSTIIGSQGYEFRVNLQSLSSNQGLALLSGIPVFSYSNGTWVKSADCPPFIIGRYTFDVSIEGNVLTLTTSGTLTESEIESITQQIITYLSTFTTIVNDLDNTVTLDNLFAGIETDFTQRTNITNNREVVGYIEATFKRDSVYETNTKSALITDNILAINQGDLSGLTSYTLNGITIYYGTLSVNYTQSYQTTMTNLTIGIDNSIFKLGETVIYEIWGGESEPTLNTITKASDGSEAYYTNIISPNYVLTNEANQYGIELFAGYAMSEDDLNRININVQDSTPANSNLAQFVYTATLNRGTDGTQQPQIENIAIYFQCGNGYLSLMYRDQELTGEDGITAMHNIFAFSDSNNNTILQYDSYTGNFYIFYSSSGRPLDPMDEDDFGDDSYVDDSILENAVGGVVTDINHTSYVYDSNGIRYSVNDLLNSSRTPYLSKYDINNMFRLVEIGSNYYIIQEDGYNVIQNPLVFNINRPLQGNTQVTFTNSIETKTYDWKNTRFAEYTPYSISTEITKDDADKFDILINNANQMIYSQEFDEYENLIYKLSLKPGFNQQITFNISIKDRYSTSPNLRDYEAVNETSNTILPALSIILMNDTSFNNIDQVGFMKKENVNIIGNGYYISYFGAPFFNSLIGTNTFVKDVSFLGENHDTLFIKKNSNYALQSNLYNIKLYGSVTNFNKDYGAIIDYSGNYQGSNIDITTYATITTDINVNNNIASNSTNKDNMLNNLLLFRGLSTNNTTPLSFTNYGFISASNGEDGLNGNNGKTFGEDGEKGEDGNSGYNVIISNSSNITTENYTNYGFIKAGDGGNGGAGGSGYRAEERLNQLLAENEDMPTPGTPGQGGDGGNAGLIKLVYNDTTSTGLWYSKYAQKGIKGLEGATGRYGLTRIGLIDRNLGYKTSVWNMEAGSYQLYDYDGTTSTEHSFKLGELHNGTNALKTKLAEWYTLSDDYSTKFISTEWQEKTYDELKIEANTTEGEQQ